MSDVFPGAPAATVTRLERDAVPAELVDRLRSIRHYDGQPIPADAIIEPLLESEAVPA